MRGSSTSATILRPCGCLRDSDPFRGVSGAHNYNWCVELWQAVA